MRQDDPPKWLVQLAVVGVVACSASWPVWNFWSLLLFPPPTGVGPAVVGNVLFLPLHLWLVWEAAQGRQPRAGRWVLAVLAMIILGGVPVVGVYWLSTFAALGLAVLIVLPPPWSWAAYAVVLVSPLLVAYVFGDIELGLFPALNVSKALALFLLLRLIAVIRQLAAARAALAEEAVVLERARIDDDLRRTVGPELAEIVRGAERARAAAEQHDPRAEELVREVADRSREVLAGVRRMIRTYRQVPVRAELDTAATLLQAAGVETRIDVRTDDLPSEESVRGALRAALGRLLSDATAERCTITVGRGDGRLGLDVPGEQARTSTDEPPRAVPTPLPSGGRPGATGPQRTPGRRTLGLMVAVELVFLVPSPTYVIVGFTGGGGVQGHPLVAVLVAIAIGVIQLRHGLAAARGERPRGWRLTFGALAVLVYLPMLWWTWNWAAMQWFVMASALMLLRGRTAVLVTAAPLLGTVTTAFVDPVLGSGLAHGADEGFYWVTGLGLGAFAVFGSARLVRALDELQATRAELAEAAVGRERLRMSRDLHDVLGQALSAVSLKGDLALALLRRDSAAARGEIDGMIGIAGEAVHGMRAVTRGEPAVSLPREVDAAVRLLSAAGIHLRVEVDEEPSAPAVERLLAWAVREGTTNVLRHSVASACRMTLVRRDRHLRLEVVNDGAELDGPFVGTGLVGLAERARVLAGTVDAQRAGERFRLVVEVPEEPP